MDLDFKVLEDPARTSADCETFIHACDEEIQRIRRAMLQAHDILDRKIKEERFAELSARPADFPETQHVGRPSNG